jgi:hypothetical protein
METVSSLADKIRAELVAWRRTQNGRHCNAPDWWSSLNSVLDDIQQHSEDPRIVRGKLTGLVYLLVEFGPVSPSIAPSIAALEALVAKPDE